MAAQWEARAQQEATRMGISTTGHEDDSADADTTTKTISPDAFDSSTPAVATHEQAEPSEASSAQQDILAQEATVSKSNGQAMAVGTDAATPGSLGTVQELPGPAVDANADPAMGDILIDAKASDAVAGVTDDPNATNADAVEENRQRKTKSVVR